MCTNYRPTAREVFAQKFELLDDHTLPTIWADDACRDYTAPIIIPGEDGRLRFHAQAPLAAGRRVQHDECPRRRDRCKRDVEAVLDGDVKNC